MGPNVKSAAEERVIPLLEGRITDGQICNHVVTTPIHGTVIEVGAGSGMWADAFARVRATTSLHAKNVVPQSDSSKSGIAKIYGVERNLKSAAALRQRVKGVGLADIYEVLPVGIESLINPGASVGCIPPESVDCIAGALCLCSIPDADRIIRHLYDLLKPGGQWYVYEHVKASRGGFLLRLYQSGFLVSFRVQNSITNQKSQGFSAIRGLSSSNPVKSVVPLKGASGKLGSDKMWILFSRPMKDHTMSCLT
ncbi:putative Methyltransferase type 11 domain-containing protein [Seiridium cardinale]